MHAPVDLGVLGLAGVLIAVHVLGEAQSQLYSGQVAAVESALGRIDRTADRTSGLPPGHLGRRIAARRLADELAARASFEYARLGAYFHHLWENCGEEKFGEPV